MFSEKENYKRSHDSIIASQSKVDFEN